jgi:quercetin dioxygenase-like cupin family protein
MTKYELEKFTRGWVVGDFSPSIIQSKDFEFMVHYYKSGDTEKCHVHKIADEITVIVTGHFKMNDTELRAGDVVHLKPGEPSDFECISDGATAVVKTPSVTNDKYLI